MSKDKLYKRVEESTISAASIIDRERTLISVSPAIDAMLGGGIQSGSLVIIRGKYKAGKTTTCLHFAKKAQEQGYRIVYLNIEARLTRRDLESIPGLDLSPEKFEIIQSNDATAPLSGEEFVAIGLLKLQQYEKCVVYFDSFSQLLSEDNLNGDITERTRDSMPLTLSKFCKRALPILNITDNICIGITHDIANTGPGHATKAETSGNKIQYANSFKLWAKWASPWEESIDGDPKNTKQIGQLIHWECENSALGPPGQAIDGRLRYGIGIDEMAEWFDLAQGEHTGVITKKGTWYFFGEVGKAQGQLKFIDKMREEPEFAQAIIEEVKARLGS